MLKLKIKENKMETHIDNNDKEETNQNKGNTSTGLGRKEISSLRKHKYEDAVSKYKISYTILNEKTGVIVEMKAASAVHACTMIGWRVKNCKLIKETVEKAEEIKETEKVLVEANNGQ